MMLPATPNLALVLRIDGDARAGAKSAPCARYTPDLMAGGTDCATCGWPYSRHNHTESNE